MALRALLITPRQRWVGTNILGHTGSLTLLVVEDVAENARGDGVFGVLAGAAGECEFVAFGVFLWVEHVRARMRLVGEVEVRYGI